MNIIPQSSTREIRLGLIIHNLFCHMAIFYSGFLTIYETELALSPDLQPSKVSSPFPKLLVPFSEIGKAAQRFG